MRGPAWSARACTRKRLEGARRWRGRRTRTWTAGARGRGRLSAGSPRRLPASTPAVPAPAGAATEIAAAIEGEDGGFFERGAVIGRGGMGVMMLHDGDAAVRKTGAKLQVKLAGGGDGTDDGHGVDLGGFGGGEIETG